MQECQFHVMKDDRSYLRKQASCLLLSDFIMYPSSFPYIEISYSMYLFSRRYREGFYLEGVRASLIKPGLPCLNSNSLVVRSSKQNGVVSVGVALKPFYHFLCILLFCSFRALLIIRKGSHSMSYRIHGNSAQGMLMVSALKVISISLLQAASSTPRFIAPLISFFSLSLPLFSNSWIILFLYPKRFWDLLPLILSFNEGFETLQGILVYMDGWRRFDSSPSLKIERRVKLYEVESTGVEWSRWIPSTKIYWQKIWRR